MSFGKPCVVCSNTQGILWTIFFIALSSPVDVVVHRHEDGAILESLRLNVTFLHNVLAFLEWHQRGVPWENLPLEHDWFSIDIVQLTILRSSCKPINSVLPRLHRLWVFCNTASETKYRI